MPGNRPDAQLLPDRSRAGLGRCGVRMRQRAAAEQLQARDRRPGLESEAQIRLAWRLALGREPSTTELKSGMAFLNAQLQQRSTREAGKPNTDVQDLALADFCQAVFALNEFIYVD